MENGKNIAQTKQADQVCSQCLPTFTPILLYSLLFHIYVHAFSTNKIAQQNYFVYANFFSKQCSAG